MNWVRGSNLWIQEYFPQSLFSMKKSRPYLMERRFSNFSAGFKTVKVHGRNPSARAFKQYIKVRPFNLAFVQFSIAKTLYFLRPLVQFPYGFLLELGHNPEKLECWEYPSSSVPPGGSPRPSWSGSTLEFTWRPRSTGTREV
jgi:hypothetical protein